MLAAVRQLPELFKPSAKSTRLGPFPRPTRPQVYRATWAGHTEVAVKLLIDKAPGGGSSGSVVVASSPVLAAMEEEVSAKCCPSVPCLCSNFWEPGAFLPANRETRVLLPCLVCC